MIRLQDFCVDAGRLASEEFFRYALAVPADKRAWVPAEGLQSVLQLSREIGISPSWAVQVISGVEKSDDERDAERNLVQGWQTIEECRENWLQFFQEFETLVRAMPDDQLVQTKWLPFNGGREHTYLEMLDYPRWNATYHTGQVAMIQLMLGDRAMY